MAELAPNPGWTDSKTLGFHYTILKAAQVSEQNVLGIPASQLSPKSPTKKRGNPFRTLFSSDQKKESCFEGKAFSLKLNSTQLIPEEWLWHMALGDYGFLLGPWTESMWHCSSSNSVMRYAISSSCPKASLPFHFASLHLVLLHLHLTLHLLQKENGRPQSSRERGTMNLVSLGEKLVFCHIDVMNDSRWIPKCISEIGRQWWGKEESLSWVYESFPLKSATA